MRLPWPRVERIIADFLNTKPESLWPERYQDGLPIAGTGAAWTEARRSARRAA